jgi:hypothetical protein
MKSGKIMNFRVLLLPVLLLAALPALAGQVTLSYRDAGGNEQILVVDAASSQADLALAASLVGEDGIGIAHDPESGAGTLAEIAAAMAAAAPVFGPDVAQQLAMLSPEDTAAIVEAVNAVPGVDTRAVLAAVHFGPYGSKDGPQSFGSDSAISLELTEIEQVPSRN